ncbi:MAG TPA: hypothetical protein VLX67_07960, partial [Stellaceae bacterium]|nr:hypothetical protein [Stellaceae bacterium]
MSLTTPDKISSLQRKLYGKAKAEPAYRFYRLYDKIYRPDILSYAYALARHNGGAPGVDGVTFEMIEAAGLAGWLAALREDLASWTYRPIAGAAGDASQTGRRGEAFGHSHRSRPGRSNRRQAGAGTDLRGG